MEARYHVISHWETPASAYPRLSVGDWTIISQQRGEGIYKMGDYGAFYYVPDSIGLTVIKEGATAWFTDEPRQMYALAEIGLFRARGHVLVGGLGLGLIHHFLRQNAAVESVTTVERAPELERLVWPHMAVGELITGDFYNAVPELAAAGRSFDTIITDFLFGYQDDANWKALNEQRAFCRRHFPNAQFLEHSYQRWLDYERAQNLLPAGVLGGMYDQVKIVR